MNIEWNLVQLSIKNDMKIIEDIKKTLSIEKKFIEKNIQGYQLNLPE